MTTLSITADLAKKRLKVEGRVAAGEKVAVTVKGFGDKSVSNTRLRVMFAERVVAIFPLPDAETGWTKDGEDLTGVLNLNTVQAESITQCGSMGCFWVLDDVSDEVRQLYGTAEHELLKWVKRPDTDVPVDLDSFPTLIEEMQQEIETLKNEIRGEWTNYQQTLSAAWTEYCNSLANLYRQFANHVSSLVKGKASAQDLNAHTGNKSNPHEVTKSQVGLENVDNTKDVDKPVSTQQQKAIASAKEHAEELVRSESRRATGKEQELQNKIDAEVRRAESEESNLDHAIRTEKSRAEGAESELRELIKTDVRIEFDSEPIEGSQKAVRSGGIWSWVKHLVTGKLAEKRAMTDRSWGASALRIKPECLPITNGEGAINTYDWSAHSIEASTETPDKFELLDANGVSAAVINPDGTVFGGDRIVFNGTNLYRGLSVAEFATDTLALTSEVLGALAALPAGFTSLYDWCVSQLAGKLDKSGGTITGGLTFEGEHFGIKFNDNHQSISFSNGNNIGQYGLLIQGKAINYPSASGTLALTSDIPNVRYSLVTKPSESEVTLDDRACNYVDATRLSELSLYFPQMVSGKARDFLLVVKCGAELPTINYASMITLVAEDDTDLTPFEGLNVYCFSEVTLGRFIVALKGGLVNLVENTPETTEQLLTAMADRGISTEANTFGDIMETLGLNETNTIGDAASAVMKG